MRPDLIVAGFGSVGTADEMAIALGRFGAVEREEAFVGDTARQALRGRRYLREHRDETDGLFGEEVRR